MSGQSSAGQVFVETPGSPKPSASPSVQLSDSSGMPSWSESPGGGSVLMNGRVSWPGFWKSASSDTAGVMPFVTDMVRWCGPGGLRDEMSIGDGGEPKNGTCSVASYFAVKRIESGVIDCTVRSIL